MATLAWTCRKFCKAAAGLCHCYHTGHVSRGWGTSHTRGCHAGSRGRGLGRAETCNQSQLSIKVRTNQRPVSPVSAEVVVATVVGELAHSGGHLQPGQEVTTNATSPWYIGTWYQSPDGLADICVVPEFPSMLVGGGGAGAGGCWCRPRCPRRADC